MADTEMHFLYDERVGSIFPTYYRQDNLDIEQTSVIVDYGLILNVNKALQVIIPFSPISGFCVSKTNRTFKNNHKNEYLKEAIRFINNYELYIDEIRSVVKSELFPL